MDKIQFTDIVYSLIDNSINDSYKNEYQSILNELNNHSTVPNDMIDKVLQLAEKEQDLSTNHLNLLNDTIEAVTATIKEMESLENSSYSK